FRRGISRELCLSLRHIATVPALLRPELQRRESSLLPVGSRSACGGLVCRRALGAWREVELSENRPDRLTRRCIGLRHVRRSYPSAILLRERVGASERQTR